MCYWLTVHGFLLRGVMSELDSGERGEAVLRALFPINVALVLPGP